MPFSDRDGMEMTFDEDGAEGEIANEVVDLAAETGLSDIGLEQKRIPNISLSEDDQLQIMKLAARYSVELCKALRSKNFAWGFSTSDAAAEFGNAEVLKWMMVEGGPINTGTCCVRAMRGGHVAILELLQRSGRLAEEPGLVESISSASLILPIKSLQWVTANGYSVASPHFVKAASSISNTPQNTPNSPSLSGISLLDRPFFTGYPSPQI